MDNTILLIILLGLIAILIVLIIGLNTTKEKVTQLRHLIQDNKVTIELVFEKIKLFKPQIIEVRKNGFRFRKNKRRTAHVKRCYNKRY